MPHTAERIDVHHHIFPPEYVAATARLGVSDGGGIAFPKWSPSSALRLMDRMGIATGIASVAAPGVHFGDDRAARTLARRCNEYAARLVSEHPERFGAFAALPLPDVDGALEELAYALDTLRLDGVVLLASVGERYLGDPAFDPLFDELNRRRVVTFIHPTVPATSHALKLAMPGAMVEFVFDTTRAVANLIFSGTLERYRDIPIILSHAGGTVPYIAWRLAQGAVIPALQEKAPRGAIAYLRDLYYDTAMSATPYAMSSLRALVDPSRILFGSDTPFLPEPLVRESIDGLADRCNLDLTTRARIERDNALALFPRLRESSREVATALAT
jgi:predicted TIM-barrel fold metal-dependent hydrolase